MLAVRFDRARRSRVRSRDDTTVPTQRPVESATAGAATA
jgi:hypothetical protein